MILLPFLPRSVDTSLFFIEMRDNCCQLYHRLLRFAFVVTALALACPFVNAVTANTATDRQAVDDELRQLLKRTAAAADSFDDKYDAEVWLVAMSEKLKRYIKNPEQRMVILHHLKILHRQGYLPRLFQARGNGGHCHPIPRPAQTVAVETTLSAGARRG